MSYVIAEPCIGVRDTACVDACPVDCIHPRKNEPDFEGAQQLFIDPVECIDCGACVPACPVSAIFALDDLPDRWSEFARVNAAHYGRSASLYLQILRVESGPYMQYEKKRQGRITIIFIE